MEAMGKRVVFFLLGAVWLCPVWVFAGPNERASVAIYFGYEVDAYGVETLGQSIVQHVEYGDTLTATLYVHNAVDLIGYELSLGYNRTKLEFLSWSENGASSNVLYRDGGRTPSFIPPNASTIPLSFSGEKRVMHPSHAPDGHGVLGEMRFLALEGLDSTRVTLVKAVLKGLDRGETAEDWLISGGKRPLHNDILDGVINGSVRGGRGGYLECKTDISHTYILLSWSGMESDALPIFKFYNGEITERNWRYARPLIRSDFVGGEIPPVTAKQCTVRTEAEGLPKDLFRASYHFAMGTVDSSFSALSDLSNSWPVVRTFESGTNERAGLALHLDPQREDVRVRLTAHNVHNLYGYSATVWYDSTKLNYVGWATGEKNILQRGVGDLWLPPVIRTDSTVTLIGLLGRSTASDAVNGEGDLGVLYFTATEAGQKDTTVIRFQEVVLQSVFYDREGTLWRGSDTIVSEGEAIHTDVLHAATGFDDTTPPNAITDLKAEELSDSTVALTWTNPNEGSEDEGARCIFKAIEKDREERITEANWNSIHVFIHADFFGGTTPRASAGGCTLYTRFESPPRIAVRLLDDAWNVSDVSNNVAIRDSIWIDHIRARACDLEEGWARHPLIHLGWGAMPDPTRDRFRIYRRGRLVAEVPDTVTTWMDLTPDWTAEDTLFYEIAAVDGFGNEGARTERGGLKETPPSTPEIESISSDYKTVVIRDEQNPPGSVEYVLDLYRFVSKRTPTLFPQQGEWRGGEAKMFVFDGFVMPGGIYVYALRARTPLGSESGLAVAAYSSDPGAIDASPPEPMQTLRAVDAPEDDVGRRIHIGWSLSPDDTSGSRDVGYYVLMRATEEDTAEVAEIPRSSRFERLFPEDEALVRGYVDVDVAEGRSYKYAIAAMDLFGNESPFSPWFQVMPLGEPQPLVGDFDKNGQVDLADFSLFVTKYGRSVDNEEDALYDLDKNGTIALGDFSIFVTHYGESSGAAKIGTESYGPWVLEKEVTRRNASVCLLVRLSTSTSASTCLPAGYQFVVEYDPLAWRVARACDGSGSATPFFMTKNVGDGRLLIAGMISELSEYASGGKELARMVFESKKGKGETNGSFALSDIQVMDTAMQIWRLSDVRTGDVLPEAIAISANVPNPFNASTTFRVALPRSGILRLEVYDVLGQRVRTIADGNREAGFHTVIWDGKDEVGNEVGSGVYLCRLQAGDFMAVRKMLLLK